GGLAGPDVDDIVIGGSHREGADGGDGGLIGQRRPGAARIRALPYTARDRAKIVGRGVAGDPGDGQRPSAAIRPDAAPLQRLEQPLIDGRCGLGSGDRRGGSRSSQRGGEDGNQSDAAAHRPGQRRVGTTELHAFPFEGAILPANNRPVLQPWWTSARQREQSSAEVVTAA